MNIDTATASDLLRIDPKVETDRIVASLRDLVFNQLRRRGAVIGVSGGIDSSVVAFLCARAFGSDRVRLLFTPEAESSPDSLRLGRLVADSLGAQSTIENISPILSGARCYERRDDSVRLVVPEYGEGYKCKIVLPGVVDAERYSIFSVIVQSPDGQTKKVRLTPDAYLGIVAATNFKQRSRKMIEYHYADLLQYAVAGTPNKLEYELGFFVKSGDGAADFKPIAHLYKSQVYQLAAYLGVPEEIQHRPPTTDTYSLDQSQEEFYFMVPLEKMDLCLYGKNKGISAANLTVAAHMEEEQIERVYKMIDSHRKVARYLLSLHSLWNKLSIVDLLEMSTVTTRNTTISSTVPLEQVERKRLLSDHPVRSIAVLLTLLACLTTLEIGLRLIGRYHLDSVESYFAQSGISYGLKKDFTKRIFWPTMSFIVHTDEYGSRVEKPGPRNLDDKPYYAILGASEVFGNGLDYEKTFIGVFDRNMASHGIQLVNLAVQGHHLLEQTARFKEFTSGVKTPPKVVIITLNPLVMGGYDDINPNVTIRRGQLFEGDAWRIPMARMILANSSAAFCFFRDGFRNVQLKYFSKPDFSLDFYITRHSTSHLIRTPEKTKDFLKRLGELEDYIHSLGATPVYVYVPTSGGFLLNKLEAEGKLDGSLFDTAFFQNLARKHSADAGIKFVDFEPMLQERYDRGEKLNFDLDAHFNGPTSQVMGEFLYRSLAPEQNILQQ